MRRSLSMLKQAVLNNKGLKSLSALLAVITWHAIQGVISHTKPVTGIPVQIDPGAGWSILDRSADTVDVLFKGSREDIAMLSRDQLRIVKTIGGRRQPGSATLRLSPRDVRGASGLWPEEILPAEIRVTLDREQQKTVPVQTEIEGRLPPGYAIQKVTSIPPTVTLRGPRQALAQIQSVRVRPIDVTDRTQPFRVRLPLPIASQAWSGQIQPQAVTVSVTIVEQSAIRTFRNLPITVLTRPDSPFSVSITPDRATVTAKTRTERAHTFKERQVVVFVDCTEREAAGTFDLPLQVKTPSGVDISLLEPEKARVVLRAKSQKVAR